MLLMLVFVFLFFLFKQKTAYEMRISDWSSDVCSSDLSSIFWYDFETTGISPSRDRPLQVAGIRTNEALEEIGEPLNIYCRPSDDILPHPAACLVTGITPATLEQRGLCEAEFIQRLHQQLSLPGTCGAGYNSLRFDDEVTRYSLYRKIGRAQV